MRIGYARVSDTSQNLDRQIATLHFEGCNKIFREKASGKSIQGRPQLEKAIDTLGISDVLVIAKWDRATRSMTEDERERIPRRVNEGRTLAKEKGIKFGRKPILTFHQQ